MHLQFFPVIYCSKILIPPEYCASLEASIREYNLDAFIKTVNEEYKIQHKKHPKAVEECRNTFNKFLTKCEIKTKTEEKIVGPSGSHVRDNKTYNNKTKMEGLGIIDIRTENYTDPTLAPIVIQLRYNEESCTPLSELVNLLSLETFDNLYPKNKIILLALSFNNASGDPAVRDWIALVYQRGKILSAQKNAKCLDNQKFVDLKYKDKHLKEYFTR